MELNYFIKMKPFLLAIIENKNDLISIIFYKSALY